MNKEKTLPAAKKSTLSTNERSIVFMISAAFIAAGMTALAKEFGSNMASGQLASARFLVQAVILLPLLFLFSKGNFSGPNASHVIRGLLLALSALSMFAAVVFMPLVDATAIFFVEPLILTILGIVFLSEPIGIRRSVALMIGFVGALIVIRPAFETVGLVALLPLFAAICSAGCIAITRKRADRETPRPMQFWISVFGALFLIVALTFGPYTRIDSLHPSWPTIAQWVGLVGIGILATIVHMLVITAIQGAPVGVIAPFAYVQILGASLIGVLYFGNIPDPITLIGIIIIIGSGLYVLHRERVSSRENLT